MLTVKYPTWRFDAGYTCHCIMKVVSTVKDAIADLGGLPDKSTYASLLRYCSIARDLAAGKLVHCHVSKHGFNRDTYIGNLLVDMYGKCGSVADAHAVFKNIDRPNVYSGNIMMAAYAQNGKSSEARALFDSMTLKDAVTWNVIMTSYAHTGDLQGVKCMFDKTPERNATSWNTLAAIYSQKGNVLQARQMFDKMPQQNVVSCNTMINAYAQTGQLENAKNLFDSMPVKDVITWNGITAAYAQRSRVEAAQAMFEKMPQQDVITWNTMIAAYTRCGDIEKARRIFAECPCNDMVSQTLMLVACGQSGQLEEAKKLFDGMERPDVVAWTAITSAYAENGHLHEAKNIFDNMPQKSLGSWNAMVAAYARHGKSKESINCFRLMDLEGMVPDSISFISALDACSDRSELAQGKLIHSLVASDESTTDIRVNNAIVNMYGRCGCLKDAKEHFDGMQYRDVVSWSGMVAVYAQNGEKEKAVAMFVMMVLEGIHPNEITFINMLYTCSHGGQLHAGLEYFISMQADYDIVPIMDHYLCMIDILGRSGQLDRAQQLITTMPCKANAAAWRTLLSACRSHDDSKRAACAADHASELDSKCAASYSLLSNIYSEQQN